MLAIVWYCLIMFVNHVKHLHSSHFLKNQKPWVTQKVGICWGKQKALLFMIHHHCKSLVYHSLPFLLLLVAEFWGGCCDQYGFDSLEKVGDIGSKLPLSGVFWDRLVFLQSRFTGRQCTITIRLRGKQVAGGNVAARAVEDLCTWCLWRKAPFPKIPPSTSQSVPVSSLWYSDGNGGRPWQSLWSTNARLQEHGPRSWAFPGCKLISARETQNKTNLYTSTLHKFFW